MITSVSTIAHQDWVVSGSKDKRVRRPLSLSPCLASRSCTVAHS